MLSHDWKNGWKNDQKNSWDRRVKIELGGENGKEESGRRGGEDVVKKDSERDES